MADKTRKCFVVGPIGAEDSETRIHADWLLDGVILPVFEHFPDFDVKRSDKITEPGMIDAQMINRLLDDDLVIADLSELNPNAFYEIGIRHMAQKPIIHLFLIGTKIPFDVSPYRAIPFSRIRHRDVEIAKTALKQAVEDVLSPDYVVENPVTRARGVLKIKESATPETKLLLDRIEALEQRYRAPTKTSVDNLGIDFEMDVQGDIQSTHERIIESISDLSQPISASSSPQGHHHVDFGNYPKSDIVARIVNRLASIGAKNIRLTS